MARARRIVVNAAALAALLALRAPAAGQVPAPGPAAGGRTRVVMLGTGNPSADPDRFGPAVVVLVDRTPYLFDVGVGVVRRWAAALRDGVADLEPASLGIAFVTHLHSDHTLGYPDLIFSTWTLGGPQPLRVYGPKGLRAMTDHLLAAYAADVEMRTGELGDAPGRPGPQVRVEEIGPGVVYRDSLVTVEAFRVHHGTVPEAFGYRVTTPDRVIVLSGDAGPPSVVAAQCGGCDLLLHEGGFFTEADARPYYRRFHTTAEALARIATDAHPKLLVLYHQRSGAFAERGYAVLRSLYDGPFVVARDLDVFR